MSEIQKNPCRTGRTVDAVDGQSNVCGERARASANTIDNNCARNKPGTWLSPPPNNLPGGSHHRATPLVHSACGCLPVSCLINLQPLRYCRWCSCSDPATLSLIRLCLLAPPPHPPPCILPTVSRSHLCIDCDHLHSATSTRHAAMSANRRSVLGAMSASQANVRGRASLGIDRGAQKKEARRSVAPASRRSIMGPPSSLGLIDGPSLGASSRKSLGGSGTGMASLGR